MPRGYDQETGIRYGVIPQHAVFEAWSFSADADYGEPHCPHCGRPTDGQPSCPTCGGAFEEDDCYPPDPLAYTLDDGEYAAHQKGGDSDILVVKSPYYTREEGEKAYCFGPDWFDEGRAPYPVYRVDNNEKVGP